MKRKIELPNIGTIYHKQHDGLELTALEKLFCELDDDGLYMAAIQEAYNQGYEDGKKWEVENAKAIKDIEGLV